MDARREYAVALGSVAVGAALGLVAAPATWVHAENHLTAPSTAPVTVAVDVTGSTAFPLGVALALVALAGVVGVVATRGLVRRLLGGVLVVVGAGMAAGAVRVLVDPRSGDVPGAASAWPALAVVGGCLVVLGGVLTAAHGSRWAVMSARYDNAGSARRRGSQDPWTALDQGHDPTVGDDADGPSDEPGDGVP